MKQAINAEGHAPSDGGVAHSCLVLTERQTAERLGVSTRTLQAGRIRGDGPPYVQLSDRRIGYALADLERWIASRSMRSTSQATVRAAVEAVR